MDELKTKGIEGRSYKTNDSPAIRSIAFYLTVLSVYQATGGRMFR
jgi:hypothetical protein